MTQRRTQLNINIDPKLLLMLKSEAIKNGKTLTEFVTEKLANIPTSPTDSALEERLKKIEQYLKLDEEVSSKEIKKGTIFTNEGAKNYGAVAKELFELYLKKKGASRETGLKQLAGHLNKLPYSNPELVFQILLGTHELTGLEMTNAYRHGSCAMRTALECWCNEPLEELNEAFLNAVISKSLA